MRFGIICPHGDSSPKVLAQGLFAMLRALGTEVRIYPDAFAMLRRINRRRDPPPVLDEQDRFSLQALGRCSVIIVSAWCPAGFQKDVYGIEDLRRALPGIPIVFLGVYYLGNHTCWIRELAAAGHFGPERYDWHLSVSHYSFEQVASDNRWSHIGMNLAHTGIKARQTPRFKALLDFARDSTTAMYHAQKASLTRLGLHWEALEGEYPIPEIRDIYQSASVFLPQARESFGVAVSEVQAMGGYVMIPDPGWLPAYRLDPSPFGNNRPVLPDTILVYGDEADFQRKLERVRERHDAQSVAASFKQNYPQYWEGKLDMLEEFVDRAACGGLKRQRPPA